MLLEQPRTEVQYKLMMEAAKKRKLDAVLGWRYDGSGYPALCPVHSGVGQAMKGFQSLGIDFIRFGAPILSGEYRYRHTNGELLFHGLPSLEQSFRRID